MPSNGSRVTQKQMERSMTNDLSGADLAWLAGLLEGEGCFWYDRGSMVVSVSMTDKDVIARFAKMAEVKFNRCTQRPPRKDMWRAYVCGKRAIALLEGILPFMGERRAERITEMLISAGKGRALGGPRKLGTGAAHEIRVSATSGVRPVELSQKYDVSLRTIYGILRGESWPEVAQNAT